MSNKRIVSYQNYLATDKWKEKAKQRREIDEHKCVMCGSRGTRVNPLCCHHFTYRNMGNEDVYTELVTLCKSCHEAVHTMMNRKTDPNGRMGWKSSLDVANHS